MLRHALLMLSTTEEPAPEAEVEFHRDRCAMRGRTHLVTTRRLTELDPGRSRVALYGDAALGNRLLGYGTYQRLVRLDTAAGRHALSATPIYADRRVPRGAAWLVELSDVQVSPAGAGLEALGGEILATGLPLTVANLPPSAARALVYYRHSAARAATTARAG